MNDRTNSTTQIAAATLDGDTGKLLMHLTTAAIGTERVGDSVHLLVPPSFQHMDITGLVEKAATTPNRKRGHVQLKDLPSLLSYCADQASMASGYIYADTDSRAITAVFNDQRHILPGWRDHRATFKAEFTPEFARWSQNNGKDMGQTEFAEFVEDNLADITEPSAQALLEVATTIQAKTGINFSSAKRLQDGQTQITYTENIEASAGAGGAMQIPKDFALGLRIFRNGEGYRLRARLKYRLHAGAVKFRYELDRPERAVEDAFAGYVAELREKSGYVVLLGAA